MRIQLISIVVSTCFLIFIFELIRREKVREAYAIIWLGLAFVFVGLSVWRGGLDRLGELVGIAYSPAALFLILLLGVALILIQYSVVISKHADKIKQLTQELGLLSEQVQRMRAREETRSD